MQVATLRDWRPSWQNSDQSIAAIADTVLCLATHSGADLEGYVIANPLNGVVLQLAVRNGARRKGLGLALLGALQMQAPGQELRFINISREDDAFYALMVRAGADVTTGQFELHMRL